VLGLRPGMISVAMSSPPKHPLDPCDPEEPGCTSAPWSSCAATAVWQDLGSFRLPPGFRGRSAWVVQLWWLTQSLLFQPSPQFAVGFRNSLLRLFGARIGRGVRIRPSASITYPWKLEIGARAWIGDQVVLYSLGPIRIGADAVVSQRSYLCAADHDLEDPAFAIRARPVAVESQAWVAADCFLAPGVTIGRGAVIGARSSVFSSMPAGMVCFGSPCRPRRSRRPLP
jgi:putative colanic acid biosynthesis acetyltransferase WcaF